MLIANNWDLISKSATVADFTLRDAWLVVQKAREERRGVDVGPMPAEPELWASPADFAALRVGPALENDPPRWRFVRAAFVHMVKVHLTLQELGDWVRRNAAWEAALGRP
jgi:hypothetical protein